MQVATATVKQRSREVTALVESFTDSHEQLVGTVQRVWVVETAAHKDHLVGHTKGYAQVAFISLTSLLSYHVC